ncbi:pitrilysin family protein [Mucilaginibacter sp. KACC 22773]|jgi:zinc protease|uniref:M16 family metallopeptidase n=1 Tax=Mucilaginibacter sp. KACC 22773 TaxID=3025671 RepID=UPI0023661474|nr:pitrilysin family protein [Mucilaginibacter sp. KACC 22773]WDF76633.1 pitrilysin family protein [Mucilaginibacter sp. KACC 22773]
MTQNLIKTLTLSVIGVFSFCLAIAQPRLPEGYFWKKLPNGLEVVVIENSKVPLATIEIAVKNGAYTEGPEFSGLSHMFEHMFFKANKDYPDQASFLKRTQELGAIWNGTTDVERVNYFFTFDRDSLSAGLKFMNAAIRFPIYREEDMKKERPVVDGEFQRAESDPGFQLWYGIQQKLWGDLITRKNPIGIHEVINTATPEKMMVIKNKYYFPNNSLLTICGDVKHDAAFAMAEKIFGDWESSGFNPHEKYPIPAFKPLTQKEYFIKETTIAQTPSMQISWQGPSYLTDSASTVAADLFGTIVGLNSSKLQQALVDKGLASSVYVSYTTSKYVGPIDMGIEPNPTKLKECYDEVINQISLWAKDDYYTDEQLKDAKAILLRNSIHRKEKPSTLASQLSYQWCSTSLNFATDLDSNYQKVTRADIKKFVDTYIIGKPYAAGLIISPDLSKQLNAASFFVAK